MLVHELFAIAAVAVLALVLACQLLLAAGATLGPPATATRRLRRQWAPGARIEETS